MKEIEMIPRGGGMSRCFRRDSFRAMV